jgi:hypothetical protein
LEESDLLGKISPDLLKGTAILVMYNADLTKIELTAKPLAVVHDSGIVNLTGGSE